MGETGSGPHKDGARKRRPLSSRKTVDYDDSSLSVLFPCKGVYMICHGFMAYIILVLLQSCLVIILSQRLGWQQGRRNAVATQQNACQFCNNLFQPLGIQGLNLNGRSFGVISLQYKAKV